MFIVLIFSLVAISASTGNDSYSADKSKGLKAMTAMGPVSD